MAGNPPVTVWRSTNGLSDFDNTGANYITDTAGFYIVDPSGFYVIDTGVTETLIPDTIWEEDNSI